MNTGKNFKIFGVRGSMLGDSIMALPVLNYLEKVYPNSYKYWSVARNFSQISQIYINHPLIDKIQVTDCPEGMGPRDLEIAQQCDIVINTMPHHTREDWFNHYNIYEETFMMAGLKLEDYYSLSKEEQRPKLEKWFTITKFPRTIAVFPFAGYNREPKRSPSITWYTFLFRELVTMGYKIYHFGHPLEHKFYFPERNWYYNFTELSLFDQIKMALGCDLTVGTDSGTALIMGAYEVPQISLLAKHWPGHVQNSLAFSTNNPNNQSFTSKDGAADSIEIENVIQEISNIIK